MVQKCDGVATVSRPDTGEELFESERQPITAFA
jgi:hypothetical protein